MTLASRAEPAPSTPLTTFVERSQEALWLITAALVPLIFLPTDRILSEAVNAYVEVPKTTGLRTLVGIMTILLIFEWVLKGGLQRSYTFPGYLSRLGRWLKEQPSRWIVVAATAYIVVTIITAALSVPLLQHRSLVSIWGEVSGQFGYSAYTHLSYFLLFAIIATHLKTMEQLWRLLAVLVGTGAIIAFYSIMQHYGFDPWDLGEGGSVRVSATMANPVFAGAALVGTTVLTLGLALTVLDRWSRTPAGMLGWAALWVPLVSMQLLAVFWTGSRGSWLLGVPPGLIALAFLPPVVVAVRRIMASLSSHSPQVSQDPGIEAVDGPGTQERTGKWSVLPTSSILLTGLMVVVSVAVLFGQADFLGQGGSILGVRLSFDLPYLEILLGFLGFMAIGGIFVLFSPGQFSEGVISFARTSVLVAVGVLIALIVDMFTPATSSTLGVRLNDVSGLPSLRALLALMGVWALLSIGILFLEQRYALGARVFARVLLVVSSVLIVAVLIAGLESTSAGSGGEVSDVTSATIGGDTQDIGAAEARPGRGLSYRTDIWDASFGLIFSRPWFEYEDLPLSFIRPLIGYGPELFKYTFPLESPLGGLLSQAHNFFIHHWVEQGILGFLASIGLFVAFFAVGGIQLVKNWYVYSPTHKWILIALLATMVAKVSETMVGVARESDLVLLWVMLAVMVVLPSVMAREPQTASLTPGQTPQERLTRQERRQDRRSGRAARRDRRAERPTAPGLGTMNPVQLVALAVVAAVAIFVGWVTWDKNVDYFWAGVVAADARDLFTEGEIRESERLMSKAVSKAPDVPIYQHNLAGIYDAYRRFAIENPDRQLPSCEDIFDLDPAPQQALQEGPYDRCSVEAYRSNLSGYKKNPTSPQAKLVLANSTLELALLGYVERPDGTPYPCEISCDLEALVYYRELTQMIPWSLPLQNALVNATFRLGRPEEALPALDRFASISRRPQDTAQALYYKGLALRRLDLSQEAIEAFEQSLEIPENPVGDTVRSQLVSLYPGLVSEMLDQERAQEALVLIDGLLGIGDDPAVTSSAFYLQGLAYRQLDDPTKAIDAFLSSLEALADGPRAADAHDNLAALYTLLEDEAKAEEHTQLAADLR